MEWELFQKCKIGNKSMIRTTIMYETVQFLNKNSLLWARKEGEFDHELLQSNFSNREQAL
jgi:hypothetical protein